MRFFLAAAFVATAALANDTSPALIGGDPVKPGEYPEVVYISLGNGRCSAAVVGPRAVLTAAHCARKNAKITFQLEQTQYSAVCEAPPGYPRQDHDISICYTDKPLPKPYASVANKAPKTGDEVTLIGYGCTKPGGGGGNDGILRQGAAEVTGFTTWDVVTKAKAALCYGDSGGPAFLKIDDAAKDNHIIFGVNSKGNIKDTSYLSKIYTKASREFLTEWTQKKETEICGLNVDCLVPEQPKVCQTEWAAFADSLKSYQDSLKELELCLFSSTVSLCGNESSAVEATHIEKDRAWDVLKLCIDGVNNAY